MTTAPPPEQLRIDHPQHPLCAQPLRCAARRVLHLPAGCPRSPRKQVCRLDADESTGRRDGSAERCYSASHEPGRHQHFTSRCKASAVAWYARSGTSRRLNLAAALIECTLDHQGAFAEQEAAPCEVSNNLVAPRNAELPEAENSIVSQKLPQAGLVACVVRYDEALCGVNNYGLRGPPPGEHKLLWSLAADFVPARTRSGPPSKQTAS